LGRNAPAFAIVDLDMPITRLNHAVLYVRDAKVSAEFYMNVLGFRPAGIGPEGFKGAAFLQAPGSTNDHDIGLFTIGPEAAASRAGRSEVGLYHLAWEVDTLAELERLSKVLSEVGSLVGASDHGTTKSLYAKDPDGIEFEIAWIVPADQLDAGVMEARKGIGPLDIAAEQRRYGATTPGGIGISTPQPA
jgi:catechol-2,3-dioxygenase